LLTNEEIAKEFHTSIHNVHLIASSKRYITSNQEQIKWFFKQIEDDYLEERKSSFAFFESIEIKFNIECNT